jgi:Tfp pilus assembly PilM family ATPase
MRFLQWTTWIGLEIGTRLVKVARVQKTAQGWTLRAAAATPVEHSSPEADPLPGWRVAIQTAIKQAGLELTDHPVALLAPRGWDQLQLVEEVNEQQLVSASQVEALVRERLGPEWDNHLWDCWTVRRPASKQTLWDLQVVLIARSRLLPLLSVLWDGQADCRVVDAAPWCHARALGLARSEERPTGVVVDWGWTAATLTVVWEGQPSYSRLLRNIGLQRCVQLVREALEVSAGEAEQLLWRTDMPGTDDSMQHARHELLGELLTAPLEEAARELHRTLDFVAQRFGGWSPGEIWLLGGAATIPEVLRTLEHHLGLPVRPWQLSAAGQIAPALGPLYANAASLSSLGLSP